MRRVLLANELGDGFGHAARLLRVAQALSGQGFECVFAVRDPVAVSPVLGEAGFRVLQAPLVLPVLRREWTDRTIVTFGDILASFGFADPNRLLPLVRAWHGLLDVIAPDLVIADFAPVLCLGLYPDRPPVLVGNGYTVPPAHPAGFPKLRDAEPLAREGDVLAAVKAVQRRLGRAAPPTLAALFAGVGAFVTTLPELDPYAAVRTTPAIGPLAPLPSPSTADPRHDYFAYLSATYPGSDVALACLARGGRRGSIYLRDAGTAQIESWRDKGLTLHERPVPLADALADAAVVIHHGGPATMEAALAVGRRQLLLPRHFEQTLYARAAMRLGVAVTMQPHSKFAATHFEDALGTILASQAAGEAARGYARRLAAESPFRGLDAIVACCVRATR